jgi:hypothetical protein
MSENLTFNEAYQHILESLPWDVSLGEDNNGQLIIYTNLYPDVRSGGGKLPTVSVYNEHQNLSEVQKLAIEENC